MDRSRIGSLGNTLIEAYHSNAQRTNPFHSQITMDSMKSLNSSLPSNSSPSRKGRNPPEQLLQVFKAAALSVTNLYKTAASEQVQSRASGYQDALEDLLSFLDKEHIGHGQNSEGQRIRKWIAERVISNNNNRPSGNQTVDSDEDAEEEKRARSSSPVVHRKPSREESLRDTSRKSTSPRPESASRPSTVQSSAPKRRSEYSPPVADFTFRSPSSLSSTLDATMDKPTEIAFIGGQSSHNPAVRVGVLPRLPRSARQNGYSSRTQSRSSGSTSSLGAASGTKRRLPFGEYFDMGSLGIAKDNNSKRGRHF